MNAKYLFQSEPMQIVSVSSLLAKAYYQQAYPWAKYAVKSSGKTIYALAADRATAEAQLNQLTNLKLPVS